MTADVTLVEVAPRDGFQALSRFVPTPEKIGIVVDLAAAGFRRMEMGAFVSPRALPQMADAAEVASACLPGHESCQLAALVPNRRGASAALAAGLRRLVFVLSASDQHNRANVGCDTRQSLDELAQVVEANRAELTHLRVDIATSFDCPFSGEVSKSRVLNLIEQILIIAPEAEICLCDTTGRAFPHHVRELFTQAAKSHGPGSLAFHPHDTYGFGIANILTALDCDVRIFDAAAAGLGGCPFAPGATGNIASEDVVFTLERAGLRTGIDLERLLAAADRVSALQPQVSRGHMRLAPRARLLKEWSEVSNI